MKTAPEVRGFWIVNVDRPCRPAQHVVCSVHAGPKQINLHPAEKTNWRLGLRRRLFVYGSSGFGTVEAADRRRRELMRHIVNEGYRFRPYEVWLECKAQLEWEKRN